MIVCKIHSNKKSNCFRKGDVEGSSTGRFCVELNDLRSLGREELGLDTVNDFGASGPSNGDFCGEGDKAPLRGCSTAVEAVEEVGVNVPDSSSTDISCLKGNN